MRKDGRKPDVLRPVRIEPDFLVHPTGSCIIEMGKTRVVCSVVLEEGVPPFLKGSGRGWLSAEYAMIPNSSDQRVQRERNKVAGRTQEIQRLIGRSLRACVDFFRLGERTLLVDCDVLDADGGTRTAAITGGYTALALALGKKSKDFPEFRDVLKHSVAAVSVGIVGGELYLDLDYEDDKNADVDMNVVKTSTGKFVEIQGTAEGVTFDRGQLDGLLGLAEKGIRELLAEQKKVLAGYG